MDVRDAAVVEYDVALEPMRADDAVPPGYKRTDVEVIPKDWDVVPVSSFTKRHKQGFYTKAGYVENGTRLVRITDLLGRGLDYAAMPLLDLDQATAKQFKVSIGDFLFARSGAIGRYGIVEDDIEAIFGSYIIRFVFDQRVVSNLFFGQIYQFETTISQLLAITQGSSNININAANIKALVVPVPATFSEQQAIAEALSDADALIESLQQLIGKKRALKQGAMQALLTGRQRLPGFTGEWQTTQLGTVLKFQVGCPFSSTYFNEAGEGPRLVRNRDLKSDDQVIHYSGPYDASYLVKDGDVLIGMDGDFVVCRWQKGSALLNQRVGRAVSKPALDKIFAFYCLTEPLRTIEGETSSTTVKHLSHGDVEDIEMRLPQIEEQTAIAAVLADMDAQIEALEARLDKTRALKVGMMQQLLTGRIRLPLDRVA